MRTFVLITKDGCPWCDKAEDLLTSKGEDWHAFIINKDPVFRAFLKLQGIDTVPQVFLHGTRIGGYEDLEEFLRDGNGVSADG